MPGEPSSIKTQVFVPGKGAGYRGPKKLLTFEMICDWIKIQGFDEYTTNGLIELASKYPTQALPHFRRNFNLMIARVREQRRKDQGGAKQEVQEQQECVGDVCPLDSVECAPNDFDDILESPKIEPREWTKEEMESAQPLPMEKEMEDDES